MRIEELTRLCLMRVRASGSAALRLVEETFPERQILIRELDRISIYRLGRGAQLTMAAFAAVTAGWAVAVVIGLVFGGPAPRPRDAGIVVAVKLDPAGKPPIIVPRDIPREIPREVAVPSERDYLLAAVDEIAPLDDAAEPAQAPTAATNPAVAAVEQPVEARRLCHREPEPKPEPEQTPSAPKDEAVLDRLRSQLAAVSERVFALATRGLGAPAPAEDARNALSLEEEGEAAALAQMASLERHVDRLASGVSALRSAETELLREVQPQLAYFIATAERVIERAGMDLDDVFQERDKPKRTAEGGPFIAAISGPLAAERAALQSDLAYWQAMRAMVKRMPLAAPLDRYAISSSYGTRRDPMNSRQAMHHGLDLISAPNAPIRAPAPGIVVFAGRNGGYGNMVEIDHGRSLRTRYAHLRTIRVKAGDKVEFQEKLGTLGNSGRSTGAHLHYEILIAGKSTDPLNFIKAGQHVFQD